MWNFISLAQTVSTKGFVNFSKILCVWKLCSTIRKSNKYTYEHIALEHFGFWDFKRFENIWKIFKKNVILEIGHIKKKSHKFSPIQVIYIQRSFSKYLIDKIFKKLFTVSHNEIFKNNYKNLSARIFSEMFYLGIIFFTWKVLELYSEIL